MAETGSSGTQDKTSRLGCAILGWGLFLLIAVVAALFGYRLWFYADKLRRGEMLDISQTNIKLTEIKGAAGGSLYADPVRLAGTDQPTLGNDQDPKLTIVEFGDFQCPYSAEAATVVRTVMAHYGDKVRFIYRDFPVESLHPAARQASLAAECAREQGKFWPYHDKLYANQSALASSDLIRYAQETGLDARQFESCLVSDRSKDKVDADIAVGREIGIRGTPTFFFGGQRVEGDIPEDLFVKIVEKMLQ